MKQGKVPAGAATSWDALLPGLYNPNVVFQCTAASSSQVLAAGQVLSRLLCQWQPSPHVPPPAILVKCLTVHREH